MRKSELRALIPEVTCAARKSDVLSSQHAAVLIDSKSREIISIGYNRHFQATESCKGPGAYTLHAEMSAIFQKIRYIRRKRSLVMYVVRLMKNGSLGNSHPCEDCKKTCEKYGITLVFYSV